MTPWDKIIFPIRAPNRGSDLALDAVLRQLPGLPSSAVEETMAPHVQKIASRIFRKSKGSDQVRIELRFFLIWPFVESNSSFQVSVSPAMLSFLDFYSSRLDFSVLSETVVPFLG